MSAPRVEVHELYAQSARQLAELDELARAAFPQAYALTILPLLRQLGAALEGLPEDHAAARERVLGARDSLRDLDALLEAYSLCAGVRR